MDPDRRCENCHPSLSSGECDRGILDQVAEALVSQLNGDIRLERRLEHDAPVSLALQTGSISCFVPIPTANGHVSLVDLPILPKL